MSLDDGYGDAREALRALLDTRSPTERRELALSMGEQALELAHSGDTELDRALGMSMALLSVSAAHVAALEAEVRSTRDDFARRITAATEAGVARVLERVEAIERVCPGVDDSDDRETET
jgi:hypothetical protein